MLKQGAHNMALAEWQLDTLAMWSLETVSAKEIAKALGCHEATVKKYLAGENDQFNRIRDGYRQQIITGKVHHQLRLVKLLNQTYDAIERGLRYDKDPRVGLDATKLLYAELFPKEQRGGPLVQINQDFRNPQVLTEVKQVTAGAARLLESLGLSTVSSGIEGDPHIIEGDLALPRAVAAAESEGSNGGDGTPHPASTRDDTRHPDGE